MVWRWDVWRQRFRLKNHFCTVFENHLKSLIFYNFASKKNHKYLNFHAKTEKKILWSFYPIFGAKLFFFWKIWIFAPKLKKNLWAFYPFFGAKYFFLKYLNFCAKIKKTFFKVFTQFWREIQFFSEIFEFLARKFKWDFLCDF